MEVMIFFLITFKLTLLVSSMSTGMLSLQVISSMWEIQLSTSVKSRRLVHGGTTPLTFVGLVCDDLSKRRKSTCSWYLGCQGYDNAWVYDRSEVSRTGTSLWSDLSGIRWEDFSRAFFNCFPTHQFRIPELTSRPTSPLSKFILPSGLTRLGRRSMEAHLLLMANGVPWQSSKRGILTLSIPPNGMLTRFVSNSPSQWCTQIRYAHIIRKIIPGRISSGVRRTNSLS